MTTHPAKIAFFTFTLLSLLLLLLPVPENIEPTVIKAGAIILFTIGLWATSIIPPFFGSMIFLFAAAALAIAPPAVVFSGFHSGAMWLVFGGLVFGLGVKQTGLDRRLVRSFIAHFPKHYIGMIYGIFWIGTALAFLVPSAAGRVALLVPIMAALAKELGFEADENGRNNGRTGLILAASMGTMTPAFNILPANVPNMALYGAADSVLGIQLTYADYFLLNFPVMGIFPLLVYPAVIAFLFRAEPTSPETQEAVTVWDGAEKRLLWILGIALLLWITDSFHGVSPAWVAMGAAIVCLLPRIGLLPPSILGGEINYSPLLFLAGVIGLGAVANHVGVGTLAAEYILQVFDFERGSDFRNYTSISLISMVVGLFATMPAQPSIMVSMTEVLAQATGWSHLSIIMASMTAWGVFPFFYQAPPVVVAVGLGNLRIADVTKMLVTYMVIGILFMLPLHFLWGNFRGVFLAAS